jgi:DNA-binding response OmpR family regulator
MAQLHVPVLEDEWLIAEQIETALADAGYEAVGHVDQALALIKEGGLDGAVLDINVHGERSFRVAEQLARDATPFAFLSGREAAEGARPRLTAPRSD